MTVKRIVANIETENIEQAHAFYSEILDLKLVMDLDWIQTYSSENATVPQLSIATQGGSDTSVPDLSIEVDNLDEVHQRLVDRGTAIEYGPVTEPWGVRRFYVRDPFDRLLNILEHE